ncbi:MULTISPECIES: NAD-dependent succinate-semialdehyde dehydrogenase [unclassified Burkholderia]|uniref:NAD-dependent succinate-semialdehyde dehydrogenase n=1 Tax=unclassified Burkholderia TaxID=2613784 RepID=UPI000469CD9E|nr:MULTISPECIES: NAD-dependent succinate-semialdehyde dehydrogenase [unclassified Burkholderia]NIE82727.1 NAD-dependent succinate-semialdehyde dehydrogenase [Burkholderia sp. Tr-860]NIF62903.1 NAD-dependent succinate-semialdehyde dehydrogenase [Burkholderia sp. Cy-647]NIF86910.1 NAD-dependent succinate-semialdehyde dehydrogenase [Burkholderia sp. Cy-637]NIF93835.1 NAD-dependent succinate-semialdehyde dehydrogenase [Burkholderia sp. Ax-1720]
MAYQSVNPANNELIRQWPNHTDEQVEAALASAHRLYKSEWSKGPIAPRLAVLHRLAEIVESRAEELARIITQEMGKRIVESRGEVQVVADIARFYADNGERFLAPTRIETAHGEAWLENHPIGVLVAVEPWNFPLYQLMRVLAPNLAAGNPIVSKHASNVPHSAAVFEEMVLAAGAPQGAWTNLFIHADQVAALIADDRVQGAALTGSEKAGSVVAAQAGKYLKKTTLELGGNDVFVVLDDADLERAVKVGTSARLNNAGQVCTSSKRFVVHANIAEAFLRRLTESFGQVRIGDPLDERTQLGPLSSAAAREGIVRQVAAAVEHGATLHYGGRAIDGPGNYFEPTILTGITRDNPAYFEEFFGPVAQVYVVADDDAAAELANDSHYGLAGVVFSRDIERARRLASRIETGAVWINALAGTAPELPFGGVKRSGHGKELSELGIKEFVNQKLVLVAKS